MRELICTFVVCIWHKQVSHDVAQILQWLTHICIGPFHPYTLDESICHFRCVSCNFSFLFHFWQKFLYANSVDPDQKPRPAVSDLGLHCLPRSQKRNARLIWVKTDTM